MASRFLQVDNRVIRRGEYGRLNHGSTLILGLPQPPGQLGMYRPYDFVH